jgi:nitroreductase
MVLSEILKRKSEFAFSSRLIEEEKIKSLFEAAQQAPSAMNVQPWRYIYATPASESFDTIVQTMLESNKMWVKEAPLLIVSVVQKEYEFNGNVNSNRYAYHDVGMANAFLMLQASNLGLVSHPIGGFQHDKLAELLKVPATYEAYLVIAVGYPGETNNLPADLLERQNRPRTRMNISNTCFYEKWPEK